jgi:HlyD family secretion protein
MKADVTPASIGNAIDAKSTDPATRVESENSALKVAAKPGAPVAQRSSLFVKLLMFAVPTALIGAGAFAVVQMNNHPAIPAAKSAPPAVTVSTAKAKIENINDFVTVTGSVSAWDPLSIGAEVSGLRITQVNVEEGDLVKKGQVLARLNSGVLEAQLAQAKARLASAQATLKKAIMPNRAEEVDALKATLAQEEANIAQEVAHRKESNVNLANAQTNADRWAFLVKSGAVSANDWETKQLAADAAKQELLMSDAKIKAATALAHQAKEKLLQAENGGRREDVEISRASIAETKGQIEQLQQQIKQTVIVAPDDGLVSKRDGHIGDIANAGTPLFSLIRLNRLELRAQVPDIDLVKFKTGQVVHVSSTEETGKILGRVALVSPQVDPISRLGTVRISVPGNVGLKPGMFVRGQVDLGHRMAVTVPVQSVVSRNGEAFVFTLDGDRAINTRIQTGVCDERIAEVTAGLKPGEEVVFKGARFLSDHDVVRVSQ